MADNVFVQHGDFRDAANLAQALGAAYRTSFLVNGFSFSVDLGDLELDVDDGVAAIWRGDMQTEDDRIDPPETRSAAAHVVEIDQRQDIELTDNDTNHIWLDPNIGTSDSPKIEVNTSGDAPSDESVKIGEVDTNETDADDATSERWRLVADDGTLTFPDVEAAEATVSDLRDGTVVFARASGERHVVDDGSLERLLSEIEGLVEDPKTTNIAEIADGDSIEYSFPVPDGSTVEVYRWGSWDVSTESAPTGLDVELLDGGDVVQASANTVDDMDTDDPVASHENSSGLRSIYKLRAKNDTGDAIDDPGVGAHFAWRVV